VIGVILMEQSVTAAAASIVVVIAVGAERGVFVAVAVIGPDNRATAVTGGSVVFVAVGADDLTVDFLVVIVFDKCSAVRAVDFVFFHCIILLRA
jgi:hypothetical protein